MDIKNENIHQYCRITDILSPVTCVHRGNKVMDEFNYSKLNIDNLMCQLDEIVLQSDDAALIRAIEARKFEHLLIQKYQTKPQSWIDSTLTAISANWRTPRYYFTNFFIPENIDLIVNSLEKINVCMKKELNTVHVVDCICSITKIRDNFRSIKNIHTFNDKIISKEQFRKIDEFATEAICFIEQKKIGQPFYKLLGENDYCEYIFNNSGISLDIVSLEEDILSVIKSLSNFVETNVDEKIVNPTKENIINIVDNVISTFDESNKNGCATLFNKFRLIDDEKFLNYNGAMNYAFLGDFFMDTRDENKEDYGFVFFNSLKKIDESNLIQIVAHEIFPGHYYANTIRGGYRFREKLLNNDIVEEGWAKYSELMYILKLKNRYLLNRFLINLKQIATLAYASVLVNTHKTSIEIKMNTLSENLKVNQNEAKNLLIKAINFPLETISYLLGLSLFVNYLGITPFIDLQDIKKRMTNVYDLMYIQGASVPYKKIRIKEVARLAESFARIF